MGKELMKKLPEQTRWSAELLWEQLELVERHIARQEKRLEELVKVTPEIALLQTLPGVGLILASVIAARWSRSVWLFRLMVAEPPATIPCW